MNKKEGKVMLVTNRADSRMQIPKRPSGVNKAGDSANRIGLIIISGALIILLSGMVWSYTTKQQQEIEIDPLNLQIAEIDNNRVSTVNMQGELEREFHILAVDTRREIKSLQEDLVVYTNDYQLCTKFVDRSSKINQVMSVYTKREIIYFTQIAVLIRRPECIAKIGELNAVIEKSKAADREYNIQIKYQCDMLMDGMIGTNMKSDWEWDNAWDRKTTEALALNDAEKDVVDCLA